MYMANLRYHRARSLAEAERLFSGSEEAAFLSGGHTLLPALKNRLAAPEALIDLRAIPELHGIRREGGRLTIGAATTHFDVSADPTVRAAIPALAGLAGSIADPQVRHLGTIGGSVANNDPAADYPAAVLALGAEIETSRRRIAAADFFAGLYATLLEPGEIVTRLAFPEPAAAGYAKFCSQASRYAMAGAFVVRDGAGVRVAVTGSGADGVFRWTEAEEALGMDFATATLADMIPDPGAVMSDLHGDADYRAHLVGAVVRLAVENMGRAVVR